MICTLHGIDNCKTCKRPESAQIKWDNIKRAYGISQEDFDKIKKLEADNKRLKREIKRLKDLLLETEIQKALDSEKK